MPTKNKASWGQGTDRRSRARLNNADDFAAALKGCETVAYVVSEGKTNAREQAITDVIAFIGAVKK